MRISILIVALWATILKNTTAEDSSSKEIIPNDHRIARQTNADQMVQNILQWLQGVYTQNARKIRQGTLREYLPPANTQKPRPFEPGYPPAGITPQPPFPPSPIDDGSYPSPPNGISPPYPGSKPPFPGIPDVEFFPIGDTTDFSGYPSERPTFPTQRPTFPTQRPTYPTQRPTYPTQRPTYPTQRPGFPTGPPTGYPTQRPGFPTGPPTGYPTQRPSFPTAPPTGYPTQRPSFPTAPPTQRPGFPTGPPPGFPTQRPSFPTAPPTGYPTQRPSYPTSPPQPSPTYGPPGTTEGPETPGTVTNTPGPPTHFTSPAITTQPGHVTEATTTIASDDNKIEPVHTEGPNVTPVVPTDEELKHPPHIHAIDVECAKDMMTISIEFNRVFNGVIYSKGHYDNPDCRYVNENSEQTKYKFTVNLNSCGTEFINAFDTQGQSYLENVLVIQNEQGIQEVWDTIRAVRCLWEGNLKDSLSVALSVGMLSQEIVTFSGDTAMAKLDIQLGRGPFAQPANGLVKIGEQMTLVISVSGDPGFDIQVRDCKATDSSGDRVYQLTDENGCILKPKIFGAFQKTRETGNTGASIIAYAFFNAFKFPDVMDLTIQCNIELCKTDCQMCPDPNQQIEPGRRRKREIYGNNTLGDGVTMGKHIRVILPQELTESGYAVVDVNEIEGICMSTQNFVLSSVILISLLTASCFISACLWLKNQKLAIKM